MNHNTTNVLPKAEQYFALGFCTIPHYMVGLILPNRLSPCVYPLAVMHHCKLPKDEDWCNNRYMEINEENLLFVQLLKICVNSFIE